MDIEKFYEELARENGVSAEDVKREIEKAIVAAYINPNEAAQRVPRRNRIPTVEELLNFLAKKV